MLDVFGVGFEWKQNIMIKLWILYKCVDVLFVLTRVCMDNEDNSYMLCSVPTICSRQDISEILLKLALNTNQSINQSINVLIWTIPKLVDFVKKYILYNYMQHNIFYILINKLKAVSILVELIKHLYIYLWSLFNQIAQIKWKKKV